MQEFWVRLEEAAASLEWWVVLLVCSGAIAVCFWVACFVRRRGVLWGAYICAGALCFALSLLQGEELRRAWVLVAGFAMAACVSQLGLSVVLFARSLRRMRRLKRCKTHRNSEFTLPNRRNSYLRERLQTVLCEENEEKAWDAGVCGDYAQELLAKLKGVGLSTVDELRVNELAKGLNLLLMKGKLTAAEQADLNVSLSALLKIAAKYEV